jgi:hypothetical protein
MADKSIHSAMAKAFAAIEGATKDTNNPFFKTKYADLGSVVAAIKPALAANDLWFRQASHERDGGICIETIVGHASGEEISFGNLFVPAIKNDPQAFGSAMTYARRYSLQSAFGVCPEDDDGNAAAKAANDRVNNPTPVEKKERAPALAGPYTSKTALWAAVRKFSSELHSCGDSDMLEAFLSDKDSLALLKQCERDAPNLLRDSDIPDYVPLDDLIAKMRADFELIENNTLRAG